MFTKKIGFVLLLLFLIIPMATAKTANFNYSISVSENNISAISGGWLKGLFNWVIDVSSLSWLSFNGTTLKFNETTLNTTITQKTDALVSTYNSTWSSTYNATYANNIANNTWNESRANTLYAPNTTSGIQYLLNSTGVYSTYNSTYANWAYNQTYSGSTYNSTYANILNQNCPSGQVVNGTYVNGTFICTAVSSSSTYNETYALWAYNQTFMGTRYDDYIAIMGIINRPNTFGILGQLNSSIDTLYGVLGYSFDDESSESLNEVGGYFNGRDAGVMGSSPNVGGTFTDGVTTTYLSFNNSDVHYAGYFDGIVYATDNITSTGKICDSVGCIGDSGGSTSTSPFKNDTTTITNTSNQNYFDLFGYMFVDQKNKLVVIGNSTPITSSSSQNMTLTIRGNYATVATKSTEKTLSDGGYYGYNWLNNFFHIFTAGESGTNEFTTPAISRANRTMFYASTDILIDAQSDSSLYLGAKQKLNLQLTGNESNFTNGNVNIVSGNNLTIGTSKYSYNGTCTIIGSPNGNTKLHICN